MSGRYILCGGWDQGIESGASVRDERSKSSLGREGGHGPISREISSLQEGMGRISQGRLPYIKITPERSQRRSEWEWLWASSCFVELD